MSTSATHDSHIAGNDATSRHDVAIRILASRNLHQRVWLPATDKHEKLRITYSTTSNFDDQTLPVILFHGPMFGTRYLNIQFDKSAKENGVRVIIVDRPSMGGSTPVILGERIQVWLEAVPSILEHLNVKDVSLVSHSAGTIYALNTLYHLRDYLDPQNPYVALLGPWVGQGHSNVTMLKAAAMLPNSAFSGWSALAGFINNKVAPVTSWSGGVFSSISGIFQAESGVDADGPDSDNAAAQDKYGIDVQTAKEVDKLVFKYAFEEDMSGGNEEALLLLGKGPKGAWGVCEDYVAYVDLLSTQETERRNANIAAPRLKMRFFFAESDMMIGPRGRDYAQKCFSQEKLGDPIQLQSDVVLGTNHETILVDLQKGAMKTVFEDVRRSS